MRHRARLAAGLAAVGLILAGCVNLPTSGILRKPNSLPNSESRLVITPRAPDPQWSPEEIVIGFLVATGANPDNLSIARDYLTRGYAQNWHPSSSATVIDTGYKLGQNEVPSRVTGGPSLTDVTVTSQDLETLAVPGANEPGTLQVSRTGQHMFTFDLIQSESKWRIHSISGPGVTSDSILLLTEADFERDYLSRYLYYPEKGSPQTLVPYPVYIPAQAGQLGAVQELVDAVRRLPTGSNWLYNAIETAFPPHTKLNVQVDANKAVVSLGGAAARTDRQTLSQMEAQLVWTLEDTSNSPAIGIQSVEVDAGHQSSPDLLTSDFQSWIPQGPLGPLYFQKLSRAGSPLLEEFTPSSTFGSPGVGGARAAKKTRGVWRSGNLPSGLGRGRFTAIAVSPALPGVATYFAGCRGKTAYVAPVLPISQLLSTDLPADCTALSWDNQGDLWAVAGSDLYVLNATVNKLKVAPVILPAPQQIANARFVSLKVAPDGLRVAMIVRDHNGASVYVSALTKKPGSPTVYLAQGGQVLTVGSDVVNPVALTWQDSTHLLVLERQQDGVSQLYEVPVNGGKSTKENTPQGADSVTSDGPYVAVGTPASASGNGRASVLVSPGLEGPWIPVGRGSTPAYIG